MIHETDIFSDAQAITAAAKSTKKWNTHPASVGSTLRNVAGGKPTYINFIVTEAFTGTPATLTVSLQSDSTENLATSPTTHATTGAIAKAALVIGYKFSMALPQSSTYEKYVGLDYAPDTGSFSTGKITAYLSDTPLGTYVAYTNNFTF